MEIGSNFWIDPNESLDDSSLVSPAFFGFEGTDYSWFSTGRSATHYVIKTILTRNPHIHRLALLPSFTCYTVIEPFINAGFNVEYYDVDKNLHSDGRDICEKAIDFNAGVILFHHLFGFETVYELDYLSLLRERGVIIIEDCTQSLYSTFPRSISDYYVSSIRKWLGVPDGGFAVSRDNYFEDKPQNYDIELEQAKYEASINKYRYLFQGQGDKETFLKQYRYAEDILDNQQKTYTISPLSAKVQMSLDVPGMKRKRINNYRCLSEGLTDNKAIKPVISTLSHEEVPLYFPVIIDERKKIQEALVKNEIYAPIVWPKPEQQGGVCHSAEYLYDHLLCIPIDQRYCEDDMKRVLSVIDSIK